MTISPGITWGHVYLHSSDDRTVIGIQLASLSCLEVGAGCWLGCPSSPHSLSSLGRLDWALHSMGAEVFSGSVSRRHGPLWKILIKPLDLSHLLMSFFFLSFFYFYFFLSLADVLAASSSYGQAQSHCGRVPKHCPLME